MKMKALKTIYHFLGSFYFAIIIITLMAIIVTAGTFTESYTDSHQYAALFTYNNPVFNGILVALFINILVAALRRWPFRMSHIPFLITHLGLLMLISGVIFKNIWGIQGNMTLIEGGSSHSIVIPHTQVLHVEKRDPENGTRLVTNEYPIESSLWKNERKIGSGKGEEFPELFIELVEYCPHCEEEWDSWIKNDRGVIAGLEPFAVHQVKDLNAPLPVSTKVKIYRDTDEVWDIYAVVSDEPEQILQSLSGDSSISSDHLFDTQQPAHKEITPKIAFIKNDEGAILVVAIDRYGHLFTKTYASKQISPLVVYNEGFGGYFASVTIPYPAYPYDIETLKQAKIHQVSKQLRNQQISSEKLSPPLQLLSRACMKTDSDFAYTLAQVYTKNIPPDVSRTLNEIEWPLLPQTTINICYWAAAIDHELTSTNKEVIPDVIKKLQTTESLIAQLHPIAHQLPNYDPHQKQSDEMNLHMLLAAMELYGVALDFLCPNMSPEESQQCLLAFFNDQINEVKLVDAFPPLKTLPFQQKLSVLKKLMPEHENISKLIEPLTPEDTLPTFSRSDLWEQLEASLHHGEINIETPITLAHTTLPPTTKLEDNRPKITVYTKKGDSKQFLTLAYDPTGQDIKWPVLLGEYRISFQPQTLDIPVDIRLHDARQINYPNTNQPMSYESDLIIHDKDSGQVEITTISMNNVYESSQGYRFYLANITPSDESAVQHVQLVVNYDPAKYVLTYPGGILIALGTLLLFWFRPKFHGTRSSRTK
jgi:hypothetical protein